MKYGNVQLSYRPGSFVPMPGKTQAIHHYLNSNTSDCVFLGLPPTRLMCILIARGEEERLLIEQILHGAQESELTIGSRYYKRVITGEAPQGREINKNTWEYNAEFIALDPIPYSVTTNEPLY